MRRHGLGRLVAIVVSATFNALSPQVQAQSTYDETFQSALRVMQAALPEQAILKLGEAADLALGKGDERAAAQCYLFLAQLMQQQNKPGDASTAMLHAGQYAAGTDLESVVNTYADLLVAPQALHDPDPGNLLRQAAEYWLLASLNALARAETSLPQIPSSLHDKRLELASRALTVKINVYVRIIDLLAQTADAKTARSLSQDWCVLLTAALRDVAPDTVLPQGSTSTGVSSEPVAFVGLLDWIDHQRPWDQALLKRALALSDQVVALDKELAPGTGPLSLDRSISLAKDLSQRADLYKRSGDTQQAITAKKEALKIFRQSGSFQDIVAALGALRDLYLAAGAEAVPRDTSPDTADLPAKSQRGSSETWVPPDRRAATNALTASEELIAWIERRRKAYLGESVEDFLVQWLDSYHKHARLLMFLYAEDILNESQDALERLLLHFDRLNFRATRRDLAVYRELGDLLMFRPETRTRLDEQRLNVLTAETALRKAIAEGKLPEDFNPRPGVFIDSPYEGVKDAKRRLVEVITDLKRRYVGQSQEVLAKLRIEAGFC